MEIRPAQAHEMDQLGLMGAYSYAGAFGDGVDNVVRNSQKPEWTLCAFDGEMMATSFAAFPFTIRANGNTLPYAGITAVGTRPEYRRQGLLRRIMTQAFVQYKEQGQCTAGLWASQAAIYRRYGFSQLGALRRYEVDTVDLRLIGDEPTGLTVNRYEGAQALQSMKEVYRTFANQRFGYLHRGTPVWIETILGEEDGPVWVAVVSDADKNPLGYVAYTLRANKVKHAARSQEIQIKDLAWTDVNAYRALWSYLGAHDLVGRVVWNNAPIDDPLHELMQEPRLLHHQDLEGSWFRLVDVPDALGKRGYHGNGAIVIEVLEDSLAPWNAGCWQLEVENGLAQVSKATKPAQLTLSTAALGAAFSGSRTVSDLVHWGMAQCTSDVMQADALFATQHRPHCPDHY